jgi:hypothetical protein
MENIMIRSFSLLAALLSIVLLMSVAFASAGTGETLATIPARTTAQLNPVTSAVNPSQILTILVSPVSMWGDEGDKDGDKDKDEDKDHKRDNDNDDKRPTPEPSTILSFGAALLIGGGVLYSRRLRKNRK